MNWSFFYQPIVTSGVIAVILAIGLVVAAWRSRAVIANALGQLRKKTFNRNGFFWSVNLVFMAVSVIHAGVFFGITGNGHDIPGVAQYLGFAVSFFLDLVTIILMQALLEAKYRSDEARAKQFLLFIIICCGTSTFANLAISLNDFDAWTMLPYAPTWIQIAAPYVLASFPLFVILMSVAAEMIINVRPLASLNEEEYEADEKKRIKLLQIRNDYLQRQADEELRALTIRSQMQMNKRLRGGKFPHSFRWFWEKPIDIDAVIAGVSSQLKAAYEPQIEELKRRLEEVRAEAQREEEHSLLEPQEEVSVQPKREPETKQKPSANVPQNVPATGTSKPPKPSIKGKLRRKELLTIAEAASTLSCTPRNVRELRKRGTLESDTSGLLIAASVHSYAETKRKSKGRDTDKLPVQNGHHESIQPLADLVELEVQ